MIVAFVPAKRHSNRLHSKNWLPFRGGPLFVNALRALLACETIDAVYLDSEDDSMLARSLDEGARALKRPVELATNQTDGHALMRWEASQIEARMYVQVLCTAPLLTPGTIDKLVRELDDAPQSDSALLVERRRCYMWEKGAPTYGFPVPNSDDLPVTTIEAMSLYAARPDVARRRGRYGERPLLVDPEHEYELIDVDSQVDLEFARIIDRGLNAPNNGRTIRRIGR